MDANVQIQIFKQVFTRWLNGQLDGLFGDSLFGKVVRPVIDELIDRYSNNQIVDAVLSVFVDGDGNFSIDRLLDKYITSLVTDGSLRFRWRDISPNMAFLDTLSGNKINVLTAEDIKELKDSFLKGVKS